MAIFLAWITFSFVAGAIGSDRTIGFLPAFFLSLFLSPIIGIVIALASTKKSTIEFQKKMLEQQNGSSPEPPLVRQGLADELAALERAYLDGKITVYQYEEQKDAILRKR